MKESRIGSAEQDLSVYTDKHPVILYFKGREKSKSLLGEEVVRIGENNNLSLIFLSLPPW